MLLLCRLVHLNFVVGDVTTLKACPPEFCSAGDVTTLKACLTEFCCAGDVTTLHACPPEFFCAGDVTTLMLVHLNFVVLVMLLL